LLAYTAEFDQVELSVADLRVSGAELEAGLPGGIAATALGPAPSQTAHRSLPPAAGAQQLGKLSWPRDCFGQAVPPGGSRWPLHSGGRAAYPSTVLMNAIPAKVAGVPEIVMVTPPGSDGSGGKGINPAILVAAQEVGIHTIYRVGGAQAIAALAYGTETIPKVDVITGPGNIYVTLAKKLVYGTVGIDSLAGPSEVLIIADESANPLYVAADLLAQAEHDPLAAAILLTPDLRLAQQVQQAVARQLEEHPHRLLVEKAVANYGLIGVVPDLATAVNLSNQFAPEHLELQVADPWALLDAIRHAGAIFLGHFTPEAVGDYLAGPSHTLPTAGAARYASALGVETFLKHSSLIQYGSAALQEVAGAIQALAQAEGLPAHSRSVQVRLSAKS
jgi:histidinol dehydrogenase